MERLSASPAEAAGIKAGDKIVSVNSMPYHSWTDRITLPATLTVSRDGKELQLLSFQTSAVKLCPSPSDPTAAFPFVVQ